MTSLLSVVIPTLNEAPNLAGAGASARAAGAGEVIVADGGSRDATTAAAHAAGDVLCFLQADARLHPRAGAVFGPAADGGYYLLALRRLRPSHEERLFRDPIPWGSDGVLRTSEALATRLGLRTRRIRVEWDLDTAADLASLRARAARDPAAAGPRLHAVLADLPVVNASRGKETQ